MIEMNGKVALVTGAATGLGASTAKALSKAGAKVVINHLAGQEELASHVSTTLQTESLCYSCDITNDNECRKMVSAAIQKFGRIDILVNNAGINKPVEHTNLDGLSAEDFHNIFNVNVVGAYLMTRAVIPIMQQQRKGVIVNVSSTAALQGYGSSIAYSASKGALNTMTKSLARALAPFIRVNGVAPGIMITPLWDKLNMNKQQMEELKRQAKEDNPLKLEPTGEQVAKTIVYLSSELASFVTGEIITSDAGSMLGTYSPLYKDLKI